MLWGAILFMLLVNFSAGFMAYQRVYQAGAQYDKVKQNYDFIKGQIDKKMSQAEQIRKYREVVTNQMDVLKSLDPPDRILWSEKVNMLASLIPANVFLSGVEVNENVEMVETEQSKIARTKWEKMEASKRPKVQPVSVKKPIIHYVMHLSGLSLGENNVEQMNNIMKFHNAMIAYESVDGKGVKRRFMDGFDPTIEFGPIEAADYEGTPVNKFIINLTTKKMGSDELQDKENRPKSAVKRVASAKPDQAR